MQKPTDRRDRLGHAGAGIIFAIIVIVAALAVLTGCASTPCDCPPVVPPEVVTVIEQLPPEPLPLPDPPAPEWTDDPFLNAYRAATAAMQAYLEAVGIIQANNQAARALPH
jgi:molybdopterin-guanine dinucleotide biosynthesis protein A